MNNQTIVNFTLLSIDALREDGLWFWNNQFKIEEGIFMEEGQITPRRVLAFLRNSGFLTKASKGRVEVDMHNEYCDGWLIEIIDHNTKEPLLALSTVH